MNDLTLTAVERQIEAMGCEIYEIGLFKPHPPGSDSREPEMLPRTWDCATLLKSVPWLRYQNSRGRNIYIRPKGEHHLSMVDDLTADAITRMKAEGYTPTLVVETSPDNFQAWLNHGQVLPQRLSTLAARALAEKFGGDKGAADWRHFGRLAGFTNRKDKYQASNGTFPFVRILASCSDRQYLASPDFLPTIEQKIHSDQINAGNCPAATTDRCLLSIDAFRHNGKYNGDGNRIDLAYAFYALSHGASEMTITDAINSRDLSKKGPLARQRDYTRRTIAKAMDSVRRVGGH